MLVAEKLFILVVGMFVGGYLVWVLRSERAQRTQRNFK
jgi:hypothetical protein